MYTNYTEAITAYDGFIDEIHGNVRIGQYRFDTSRVLREMDPIAYRVGFFDWLDGEGVDSDDLDDEGYADLP